MDLRKIATSEHFSAKRKVVSGFGVGVVASLLVFTLLFINNPFKISFSEATSGSSSPFPWFFPQPKSVISASSSSVSVDIWGEDEGSMGAKVHEGNLGNVDKNTGLLSSGVGENNIEKTHEGNFSENFENGSFLGGEETVKGTTHVGNLSETSKNESFLKFGIVDRGVEKTHLGNLSENLGEGSPLSREEMVIGKTHEGNSLENNKNVSSLNSEEAERIREQTREGNFSNNLKNGSWFSTEERINETVHEKKSPEEAKNSSIPNEGLRITEKTRESNVSKSDNNSSAVKKPHEGAQGKEKNSTSYNGSPSMEGIKGVSGKCNIFNGRWVRDEGKPYYPAGSCPHIEKDFDCHGNGRPDDDFLKWRWQPNDCNIPSLNATDFLDRLRGKRLLFVGDSLNRNMWESLVCILRHSIVYKSKVHEISEGRKFKTKGYYSFRYEDYNCSIDFIRSPFLVRPSSIRGKKGQEETLRLDLMDETTRAYREADVLVFNTGHWWTHAKTSKGKDYYQEGNYVHPMLNAIEAYEKALTTWARWIDKHVDARKTRVFFRGYSLTHFRGGQWNSGGQCHNETEPIFNESYLGSYPSKMRALEHVLESMKTPVVYLNISRLTDYRKDAHPSIYRKEYKTDQQSQDCSHWCLPGVPDTWNELLYASLVMDT